MNQIMLVPATAGTLPFDAENEVLNIPLEILKKTASLFSTDGKLPSTAPVEHFGLIDTICEMITNHGFTSHINNIYIKSHYSRRIAWPNKEQDPPLDRMLIKRCIGKISVVRAEETGAEFGSTVAFSYSENGIELALGPDVRDCGNFNIFGRYRAATFGNRKTMWDQMLELIDKWIGQVPTFFADMGDRIKALKSVKITDAIAERFYGQLFMDAVHQNFDTKFIAPLNQTQVAAAAREYMKHSNDVRNAWDLCNSGTNALHIYKNDFSSVLGATERFNDFTEQFVKSLSGPDLLPVTS